MDLLGHVGRAEVGREGPDQADAGLQVDPGQDPLQLLRVAGRVRDRGSEGPDPLDQLEQARPLLAEDRLCKQAAEPGDVGLERGRAVHR